MQLFLLPLTEFIKDGVCCKHLHDIKIEEMFWVLRTYYIKEDLVYFLFAIIGHLYDFRDMVQQYCFKTVTVQELASLCKMSVANFRRVFFEEFGEHPHIWLQKRMVGLIKYKLADKDVSLKSIVYELNFSSPQHFVRYCKRYLGNTPGKMRKTLK